LMGMVLLLEYGISAAVTARGCAHYLSVLPFADSLPSIFYSWQPQAPLGNIFTFSIFSPLCVAICTAILVRGVKESAVFNRGVTLLNICIISVFVIVGGFYFDLKRYTTHGSMPHGVGGIIEGAAVMFFCYIGFEGVSTLSEETSSPKRDIPIALFATLGITGLLYALTSFVLIGMVPLRTIDPVAPLSEALNYYGLRHVAVFISLGAVSTTFSTTFSILMGQPRIFYRMAIDGVWFSVFRQVDPITHLPLQGIYLTGIGVAIISGIFNITFLVRLISAGTILSYALINICVLLLRYCPDPKTSRNRTIVQPMPIPAFLVPLLIWLFVISATFVSFSYHMEWSNVITVCFGVVCGIITAAFLVIHYRLRHFLSNSNEPPHFKCPCVPLVPLFSCFLDLFIVAGLKGGTFLNLVLYLLMGTIFLFVVRRACHV